MHDVYIMISLAENALMDIFFHIMDPHAFILVVLQKRAILVMLTTVSNVKNKIQMIAINVNLAMAPQREEIYVVKMAMAPQRKEVHVNCAR